MSTYEEDCEFIRQLKLPITHYIYCPQTHAHWPELGGVCGALSFSETSIENRRAIIAGNIAAGRQVKACINGPYKDIQPIYRAMEEGRTP